MVKKRKIKLNLQQLVSTMVMFGVFFGWQSCIF